jgi:hypothetical protein
MKISPTVLEIASRRLSRQKSVPRSPGRLDELGEPLLCYGAALAIAAAEARDGAVIAESHARDLATNGCKQDILTIGAYYALSRRLLQRAIVKNDALTAEHRRIAILAELTAREQ